MLVDITAAIGSQIGHFIQRKRAEEDGITSKSYSPASQPRSRRNSGGGPDPKSLDVTKLEFCCEGSERAEHEEQIIHILREAEGGQTVPAVCARHNLSQATFYSWKKKFGGMDVNEARRLRSLEDENSRLKRLVATRRSRSRSSKR